MRGINNLQFLFKKEGVLFDLKPLDGIVVLDLTRAIAGPYCTLYFGDLGATVIKIENPNDPDFIRTYKPTIGEGEAAMSAPFAQYNRNKQSVTLNLSKQEGQETFKDMVKKADIVVENYRPGVMEKFGLNYEQLKKVNPKIIYTAISGYGQYGPYVKRPAYDSCSQALGGLWSINGYSDMPPVRVGTVISDLTAGLNAVIGTLAAYHVVHQTGVGQLVDVSQLDVTLALTGFAVPNYTAGGIIGKPIGNEDTNVRPFESFNTKDGIIFFGGFNDKFFNIICEYFDEPEFSEDPEIDTFVKRNNPKIYSEKVKPKLEQWFAKHTTNKLEQDLADLVPLAPIKNIAETINDPQVRARDMIVKTHYPNGEFESFGLPIQFSETPGESKGLAPLPGEHNKKVFCENMGISKDKFMELKNKGVI